MQKGLVSGIQNSPDLGFDSLIQTESATGYKKGIDTVKKKQSWWYRKLWYGWRRGLIVNLICNVVVLAFNSSLLVWAKRQDNPSPNGWILWQGSYSSVNLIDTFSHLAINIASTAILAGNNYTLQILLAPTRRNIDEAHRKKRYLDIGISSLHNWRCLSWQRRLLYISLLVPTLPIHLLYNSIIVSNIPAFNVKGVGAVTEDFLQKPPSNPFLKDIWSSASKFSASNSSASNWTQLTTGVCVDVLKTTKMYDYTSILFFTGFTAASQNNSWYYTRRNYQASCGPYNVSTNGTQINETSFSSPGSWLASMDTDSADTTEVSFIDSILPESTNEGSTGLYDYQCSLCTPSVVYDVHTRIKYCLAEKSSLSKIELIPQLLIILIICNMVKVLALSILVLSNFNPLVTIGDAIASFLDKSDWTTRHIGLISVSTLQNQNSGTILERLSSQLITHDNIWKLPAYQYSDSVSRTRWRWTLILCTIYLLTIVALIIWILRQNNVQNTFSDVGTFMWGEIVQLSNMSLTASILSVNAPQLALSSIYLAYNDIFTCMSLSKEWLSYSKQKKGLRVTKPQGEQRSTYFLSLPYRYSIPLIAKSVLLHWILSQSMFSIHIGRYSSDLTPKPSEDYHSIGISPTGLVVSAFLIGATFIVPILLSTRKLNAAMPLVRSNSLAISAACHPATVNDKSLSLEKLQYGVISEGSSGKFRVGFSDGEVRPLVAGEFYE